jgi:hypothetical protein
MLGRTPGLLAYFSLLAIATSVARFSATAIVNFARSSRASALRTFFGAAKSCSPVIFFKTRPLVGWPRNCGRDQNRSPHAR